MPRQIPDELKEKALSMLQTEDIDTVATTLRIRKAALEKMIEDESVSVSDAKAAAKANPITTPVDAASADDEPVANEKQGRYSPEFKAAALAMMEEKGAVATIKELGISSYTLYDWKKKAEGEKKYPVRQGPLTGKKRKEYSPEFKAAVISFYQENGADATLRKFGVVNNSLYNWLNEAGIKRVGNPRASDHTDAITLYREKGTDAVMEAYGITKGTLRDWLKDAGIDPTPPKYSPEFKAAAIAMTAEKPLTSVAKELGIPASTLATWKMNAKKS